MKIVHPSGTPYDLSPDTEIELTRYNPFFNELGEQSVPVSIPASRKNLSLLGYPERADNINKPASRLDAKIESGVFSVVCRQAILSAQENGSIETSFYINEGAFYEKINDLTLSEIFKDKKILFTSIDTAITFMYSLVTSVDSRFAVFPIETDDRKLNVLSITKNSSGLYKFVNEVEAEETINEKKITIPKGFFITPFVKVRHVLTEVLAYLGYTLGESLIDIAPFNEMVFLNNNIDTLVDNSINYVDIVPNITVKTLFEILRKFNVELIPDELHKVVNIINWNDMFNKQPVDISDYAVSKKYVNYHNNYRQLKLSSEMINSPTNKQLLPYYAHFTEMDKPGSQQSGTSEQGLYLFEIINQYPTAYFRKQDGAVVREGYQGDRAFIEKLTGVGLNYYAGGTLEVEDHTFPDVVPDIRTELNIVFNPTTYNYKTYPYVGPSRALRSKVVFDDGSEDDGSASELKAMLCLFYRTSTNCVGVLNNYDNKANKLWDYSLLWNGEYGLFEKFWRNRDTLLRNALLKVTIDTILPENLKYSMSPISPILLHNQKYLLSEMQYSTAKKSISECSLLSAKLQQPVTLAKSTSEYFREKQYRWELKTSVIYPGPYEFTKEPVAFYPPDPTQAEYSAGGKYYERTYNIKFTLDNTVGTLYTWLEPVLYQ